jgi:hypothetical protein
LTSGPNAASTRDETEAFPIFSLKRSTVEPLAAAGRGV